MTIEIRKANLSDSRQLFYWANDPITRKNSFNSDVIKWKEHKLWFFNKLNDSRNYIYMVFNSNIPVGVVKFESNNETIIIGVTVAPKFRGQGLGTSIIKLGCSEFWKTCDEEIFAYIKTENTSSRKAFEKAGFQYYKNHDYNDIPCIILKISKYEN